ncbi:class I SAM-dependent methyltransferase [Geitlerinema sp. PCC 9228]|jgi:2-polyprenyl-3-methyl-5-hydroxy-6-metoxy-1,4-benzoquinol methylase|uniref:class I SAM-dependent methyltransferase n=1 Tax=Geitlerinema sp. PCC 9228 TaxID=111611 RepID=UPI00147FCA3E|nr:class I SAM-dependent methyltransferase [Geitlerinema sp. PCC 9228]
MKSQLEPWLQHCTSCDLWVSSLSPSADLTSNNSDLLQENQRRDALKYLRQANFRTIFDILNRFLPIRNKKILDVGCAYGWFLEIATAKGAIATGVEPETEVANLGKQQGWDIRLGYFPDCLGEEEKFHAIAFNDAFEHFPDCHQVLKQCHQFLIPGGFLILNLPNSNGFFYRLASLLAKLGIKKPLHRLWQKDYPSPHLFYFNASNLHKLATQHGFYLLHSQSLPTLHLSGLWSRLRMDKRTSRLTAAFLYLAILFVYPILSILAPADILLQIYQKQE